MVGVIGAGISVPGTYDGVSNSNSVGKTGSPGKGHDFASFGVEEKGDAQGSKDGIVNVGNGAAEAVSEGFSSDQKGSKSDLVRSESCKRGDPKIGISWASIVEASSAENEETGRSNSSETAVAGRLFPGVADAKDNNGGQSKVVSVTGKAWSAVVAGSGKMGPTCVWVKKGPTTGLDMCSGTSGPATAGNQTGMVVGLSTDFIPTTSDLWSPAPQRPGSGPFDAKGHYTAPFLGLCDADFPPIRPLTNLGTRSEVKNSLISVPNHSHPVQLGSRTDKFLHNGNGTADANLHTVGGCTGSDIGPFFHVVGGVSGSGNRDHGGEDIRFSQGLSDVPSSVQICGPDLHVSAEMTHRKISVGSPDLLPVTITLDGGMQGMTRQLMGLILRLMVRF